MAQTKKYFVLVTDSDPKKKDLGPSIFYDASVALKIVSKDEAHPDPAEGYDGIITKKMASAIKNGFIREVTQSKGKSKATEPASAEIADMDDAQLLAYYKENWEVKKKDEDAFLKMTTEEKREFLAE
jgi:hypothetical protein